MSEERTPKGRTWKERLAPFGHLYCEMVGQMCQELREMPDDELKKLLKATERTTQTNCGWDSYGAAPILAREIRVELRSRRDRASETEEDAERFLSAMSETAKL